MFKKYLRRIRFDHLFIAAIASFEISLLFSILRYPILSVATIALTIGSLAATRYVETPKTERRG